MEIVLDRLNLHRAGRPILHDIHWHLRPGERWLVVGASGAGKTQLLKILAGDVWPDDESGMPRRYRLGRAWHTEPVEVRDELAWLGPERQDRYERYGWNFRVLDVVGTGLDRSDLPQRRLGARDRERCLSLLRAAGIARLAPRRFLTLSYGERRLVLLARALAWRAAVLLLDEVATGLDAAHRARLYALLRGRRLAGTTWVCSAHRPEDVPPGATHLMWLEAGRVRYAGTLTPRRLRAALAAVREHPPRRPARLRATGARQGEARTRARRAGAPLVTLAHADVWLDGARVLRGIDLTVRRGECWVVHGANGSGKSTLLRTIYGDHAVASNGAIRRAGLVPGVPLEHFRARTGLIAPHLQTGYPRHHAVLETVVSGLHSSIGLNAPPTTAEQRRALAVLRVFDMAAQAERPLADLSYGQVRRILFARAAVRRPRLLLLDEPFTGLDAATRVPLQQWLEEQIGRGVTVVMASHYRGEWPRRATHELVLSRGRVSYAGEIRR